MMIDEKKLIEDIKAECEINAGGLYVNEIIGVIHDQPKVGEWIPFSEREADEEEKEAYGCERMLIGKLPDDEQRILVSYANGLVDTDIFMRDGYECYLDSGCDFVSEAEAWQPLPEQFKGE